MFGLFKKVEINSDERFSHILRHLEGSISKTIKATTSDFRFLKSGISNNTDPQFINSLISQILTQKIGFAVSALNVSIRNQGNLKLILYSTLSVWEENIEKGSVKVSNFISKELQFEIYNRFFQLNKKFQNIRELRNSIKFFEEAFQKETLWYVEHNSLQSTDKFLKFTRNQFLTTFSFFDRYFSKYKHN